MSLPAIVGDLPTDGSLPRYDYIQQLIKDFRESSSPECMRRVVFGPDKTLCEYASASYHLPGAYAQFFPCPHCTYKDEDGRTSFVEVFHFPNVHSLNVCATITFVMPADGTLLLDPAECSVEWEVTKGCPNAPLAINHSPRVALHLATDIFIEVLCYLPRSELEKILLVSRRWASVIGGAAASLQQRRSFSMDIRFYGESPGMISIRFDREVRLNEWRILRVLTTRGLSQALSVAHSHLRNAFVKDVVLFFEDLVPAPSPPREMLVDISVPARIDWLKSVLRSMPPNSEIGSWFVADAFVGADNVFALASCALEPHRQLGCVQALELALWDDDVTWTQLSSLLDQPTIRAFSEVTISTTMGAIDTGELRAILSSRRSMKLHVIVRYDTEPQDALLSLPALIVRVSSAYDRFTCPGPNFQDFVALSDVNSFVTEFSLHLKRPKNIALSEMPNVDEATDRRKRFRHHLQGEDTVVRVSVYENPTARGHLTVVTCDHFRRSVVIFNGNVSLAELKQILHHPYVFY
ncbi:hypothetical protein AAVH_16113 [Aphelenchoides avenae]|nr:hypothetical protein AAVH_16113 [Aphelenchus avenae]